jgi:hypothetical protein
MKRYRERNKVKFGEYRKDYLGRQDKKTSKRAERLFNSRLSLIEEETDFFIKNMPVPFGSFEKAKYVCFLGGFVFYSFVTTCRNTEDCISILRNKLEERRCETKRFFIYKIQNGIKKLILKGIL